VEHQLCIGGAVFQDQHSQWDWHSSVPVWDVVSWQQEINGPQVSKL